MRSVSRLIAVLLALWAAAGLAAEPAKEHRLAIQVDQNNPEIMTMVLNNARAVVDYYHGRHEDVQIEIVAYGPGLTMLRGDTSPVKDRIKEMKAANSPITFSACHNTMQGMEKREGHPIVLVPEASVVPSGAVRLMQLEEQGWSYIKP